MTAATKTSALERDLSLVLPARSLRRVGDVTVSASIAGKPALLDAALDRAGQMLRAAGAPAVVGLAQLSIEAIREAVTLAEAVRGRLLPWPSGDPMMANLSVTQTATLGHLFAADAVVWVGCVSTSGPVTAAIAQRVKSQHTLPATLEAVLTARGGSSPSPFGGGWPEGPGEGTHDNPSRSDAQADRRSPHPGPLPKGEGDTAGIQLKRVAVVLGHDVDARVVSQWHKLAADVQRRVRVAVFSLPHPHAENLRGAMEVIGWQTGVNVNGGGIDFADGPRKCADAATVLGRKAADVVIDTTDGACDVAGVGVIAIGRREIPEAAVSFVVPGLALGLAARVMRCDGVVLWLCDDPAPGSSQPDPTVALLRQIAQRAGGRA